LFSFSFNLDLDALQGLKLLVRGFLRFDKIDRSIFKSIIYYLFYTYCAVNKLARKLLLDSSCKAISVATVCLAFVHYHGSGMVRFSGFLGFCAGFLHKIGTMERSTTFQPSEDDGEWRMSLQSLNN
jgi:hypothetical protein